MAAPLPLRALVLANLILRPARSRRYFTFSTRSGAFPALFWFKLVLVGIGYLKLFEYIRDAGAIALKAT
jgi:hypothetical protein